MESLSFWQAASWNPALVPGSLQRGWKAWLCKLLEDAVEVTWHRVLVCIPHPSRSICLRSALWPWRQGMQVSQRMWNKLQRWHCQSWATVINMQSPYRSHSCTVEVSASAAWALHGFSGSHGVWKEPVSSQAVSHAVFPSFTHLWLSKLVLILHLAAAEMLRATIHV